jgi:hypothetical protein
MNFKFLLIIPAIAALSSCSSVYKSGQTPDDVYYSPGRSTQAVAATQSDKSRNRNNDYYGEDAYREDQYLRMQVRNRMNTGYYPDAYGMDPFYYNNLYFNNYLAWNSPFYSPWNSYFYWNSFYNPYFTFGIGVGSGYPFYGYPMYGYPVYINNGKVPAYNAPSRPVSPFTLNSYLNTGNYNNKAAGMKYNPGRAYGTYGSYNNSNYKSAAPRQSAFSNTLRSMFGSSDNNTGNSSGNNQNNTRSYNPSSSGSSGATRSGGGGGGGSISRPSRGH